MTVESFARVAPTVTVITLGLAFFALVALKVTQGVFNERAMNRCMSFSSPESDPHYAARSEASGWSIRWHTFGYECRYTRTDGTVFHLPPKP